MHPRAVVEALHGAGVTIEPADGGLRLHSTHPAPESVLSMLRDARGKVLASVLIRQAIGDRAIDPRAVWHLFDTADRDDIGRGDMDPRCLEHMIRKAEG